MARKTYWQGVSLHSDESKQTCKTWFNPLCDDLTPYKAEILCDVDTDREKKLRAFMTDANGKHFQLERTVGVKFTISIKEIPAPSIAA